MNRLSVERIGVLKGGFEWRFIRSDDKSGNFSGRWPRYHGYCIPRTNLHAQCAAGADVVLDDDVRRQRVFAHTHKACVVRGHGDAGFTAGALVVVDERNFR